MQLCSAQLVCTAGELPIPRTAGLTDPNVKDMETDAMARTSANAEIDASMCETAPNKSKTIHLQYQQYDFELRASMVRYADLHGLQAASRHSSKLGHKVPYTTIPCSQTLLLTVTQNLGRDVFSIPHKSYQNYQKFLGLQ